MANKQKSLKSNIIYSAALSVANLVFPLVTFPYATRVLSPEGIGRITFANSIISYFIMLVMLGIPSYGMREVARRSRDKKELSILVEELLIINSILLVVCCVIYYALISLIPKFSQDIELYLLLGLQIIFNVLGVEWFYRGMESFKYITIRSIATKFFSVIFMFALVKQKSDLFIYAVITVVASAGSYLLNFLNLRKYQLKFVPISKISIRKHFTPLLILFATSIATNISTQVDTTMLGFIHGDEAVGYYSIAVKVKNIIVALTGAISTAIFPRLVAVSNDKYFYKKLTEDVYSYLMLLTVPAVVFFFSYAEKVVLLLAGERYFAAVVPMRIITITVFLVTFSCLFGGRVLVSLNKAEKQLNSVIGGTIVNCIANILLIPRFGVSGAAFATVLSETTVLIYCIVAIPKDYRISFAPVNTCKITVSALLSVLVSGFVKNMLLNIFLELLLSAIVFGIMYFIFLVAFKEKMTMRLFEKIYNMVKCRILS